MTDALALLGSLPEERLREWILAQRWFASKNRDVSHFGVLDAIALRGDAPLLAIALVEAHFGTGTHEVYQVPIGFRPVAEGWSERVIMADHEGWTAYDALADGAHGRELLHRMRASAEFSAA